MRQMVTSGLNNTVSLTTTEYTTITPRRVATWNSNENLRRQMCAGNGRFHSLRVKGHQATGGTYTVGVRVNKAATNLFVTMNDPSTEEVNYTDTISVAAGDRLSFFSTPSNSPTSAPYFEWSLIWEGDDAFDESLLIGGHSNALLNSGPETNYPSGGTAWVGSVPAGDFTPFALAPTTGTLKSLYIQLGSAVSGGDYQFNYGTASSLSATVTDGNTTANDTSGTESLSVFDQLRIASVAIGGPSNTPYAMWGAVFSADDPYEALIIGGSLNTLNNSTTEYNLINSTNVNWNSDEGKRHTLVEGCVRFQKLYVITNAAPGSGASWDFTVRINKAASDLTTQISGASQTQNSNTTDYLYASSGDELTFESDPTSTPAGTQCAWGLTVRTDIPFPQSQMQMGMGI